ncbi:MAG: FAD:protein FMN transferase, partial [Fibrobacterales bacterium]|nr:FAD:protein FMN transferase [Fibrobacterales bacterium]
MAVATSGNYERQAVRKDGTRVGHLFDPRTGRAA